ncbi:MAG TPA: peptidoglycan-binding domain-containing protein [Clostridium sp.]|uniref:peptidoglycan-binding domain-containing protein n=1 Tax=Clostridium sp. TaxID=1506 RepID=UPI002F9597FA
MKKTLTTVAYALTVAMTLSFAAGSSGLGNLGGVGVVSAQTMSVAPLSTTWAVTYGSNSSDVKRLQVALNAIRAYNLTADGVFGKATEAAVKNFQWKYGINMDGVAGRGTLSRINVQLAALKTPVVTPPVVVTPTSVKISEGLGNTTVFRNGPGADTTGMPVYSITTAMADVSFDANGRILNAYLDAYEVATPNYDGASMPEFSGWPGTPGYNITDPVTGVVTVGPKNTLDKATAEVSAWKTKRQRGDAYGMNATNEWYKQMNFYQKFFVGKTVAELDAWFAKYTTTAGRPIKATTTNVTDLAKYNKLTATEKAGLADVVTGATMSLSDAHGDFLGAIKSAYANRVTVTIPVK